MILLYINSVDRKCIAENKNLRREKNEKFKTIHFLRRRFSNFDKTHLFVALFGNSIFNTGLQSYFKSFIIIC